MYVTQQAFSFRGSPKNKKDEEISEVLEEVDMRNPN